MPRSHCTAFGCTYLLLAICAHKTAKLCFFCLALKCSGCSVVAETVCGSSIIYRDGDGQVFIVHRKFRFLVAGMEDRPLNLGKMVCPEIRKQE